MLVPPHLFQSLLLQRADSKPLTWNQRGSHCWLVHLVLKEHRDHRWVCGTPVPTNLCMFCHSFLCLEPFYLFHRFGAAQRFIWIPNPKLGLQICETLIFTCKMFACVILAHGMCEGFLSRISKENMKNSCTRCRVRLLLINEGAFLLVGFIAGLGQLAFVWWKGLALWW